MVSVLSWSSVSWDDVKLTPSGLLFPFLLSDLQEALVLLCSFRAGEGWLSPAEGSSLGYGAEVPPFGTSFAVYLLCVWCWGRGSSIPFPAEYGAERCRTP